MPVSDRKPGSIAPRRSRAVPKVIPGGSDGMFEFESSAGVIRVPSQASVEPTFRILQAAKNGDTLGVIVWTVENCGDKEAVETIGKLRASELDKFYTAWMKFSGISVGESRAS